MDNSFNVRKPQELDNNIFLAQEILILYNQRLGLNAVLNALREKYNLKVVSDEDDKITIILTQKNNV